MRWTIEWDLGPDARLWTAPPLREQFRKLAGTPGHVAAQAGDATGALARRPRPSKPSTTCRTWRTRRWSRSTARCRIGADKCEIWTGTQFQTMDQQVAAKITGLKPEQVEIHTTFLGGGFGRRAKPTSDFVSEAVHVAKAANAPVKTVWTREDDMRGGYYRPAFLHRARIGLGRDGLPMAWQHVHGRPVDPGRHAVRADDGEGWHRRHLGRRRGRLALPEGDPESPGRTCIHPRPASRCCGGARSATATPRSSWRA